MSGNNIRTKHVLTILSLAPNDKIEKTFFNTKYNLSLCRPPGSFRCHTSFIVLGIGLTINRRFPIAS